jgi:hypothetical protein
MLELWRRIVIGSGIAVYVLGLAGVAGGLLDGGRAAGQPPARSGVAAATARAAVPVALEGAEARR